MLKLSVNDPFELEYIFVTCIDYDDMPVANIPLSEFADENDFDVDYPSAATQYAFVDYMGSIFTIEYTVGYIGYGNDYIGTDDERDGGYLYRLASFTCIWTTVNMNAAQGACRLLTRRLPAPSNLNRIIKTLNLFGNMITVMKILSYTIQTAILS